MTRINLTALEGALDSLPSRHPGPGGVAGVVMDGRIIATRAWGFADLDSGQVLTPETRLPICSISKQFTCAALLAELPDPAVLDHQIARLLPRYTDPLPTMRQLCDNQSGLRDYWALTVLQGARAEQEFTRDDALRLIALNRTGHFAPGTRYSYSNGNFRIISELLEAHTGENLETLYRRHIWSPAGMERTLLTADTRHPADGVTGYEGSEATGYFPARNGITWIGDAGISSSLRDMLAHECWIDATREDENSLYRRISVPPRFADGRPARYGYGLMHDTVAGHAITGHSGALRGFRAYRMHARAARLSIVVMFNHEGDTYRAATSLFEAAMDHQPAPSGPVTRNWDGQWMGSDGLLTRVETGRNAALLRHATGPESLLPRPDGSLAARHVTLCRDGDALQMTRPGENLHETLTPVPRIDGPGAGDISGRYASDEMQADMTVEFRDGAAYARFQGLLGTGRWERLQPVGPDLWLLVTRRSMDAPAPGDWTLSLHRDGEGRVSGLSLGCWLARGIVYRRQ